MAQLSVCSGKGAEGLWQVCGGQREREEERREGLEGIVSNISEIKKC